MTDRKSGGIRRYYVNDRRQQSTLNGKPDGGWMKAPPAPAVWVSRRGQAETFTAEEVAVLKKQWPYLEGCELIPAEVEDMKSCRELAA